jgi:ribose transport system ATP-binding protein
MSTVAVSQSQSQAQAPQHPRLGVERLSKTFGPARVLKDVRLQVAPGELHGLVGQNGCGKSTLVKILTGVYTPDPGGSIEVDGRALALPVRPLDSRAAGVSVVHQNLGLIDGSTVWENVRMGRYRAARFTRRINSREERAIVADALNRLGRSIDVNARVGDLSAEERAVVAIARALQDHEPGGGLLIFDESTRALPKSARAAFFGLVRSVVDEGASVLMISHQLEEVVEVTDRVTVLRDGEVVETGVVTKETDEAGLTRLMLGRHLVSATRAASVAQDDSAARVRGLAVRSVKGFDLDVKKGEIVGLTGLIGSGAVAVAEAIGGARPARGGKLTVFGSGGAGSNDAGRELGLKKRRDSNAEFIKAGVAFVAERRLEEGVAAEMTVTENLTLPRVSSRGGRFRTGSAWQAEETTAMIKKLDIRPPDPDKAVGTLSGGNQQKVLLGKWLAGKPSLLVLHEPTQAVDVGARHDIITALREAAAEGCGVVVSSVDAADLAVLCDRVIVFRNGRVTEELTGDLDADAIIHATFGKEETAPASVSQPAATEDTAVGEAAGVSEDNTVSEAAAVGVDNEKEEGWVG